ncbi:MAG: hypothetical protein R3B07_37915 [Polyangiaceae bacterium]
MYKPVRAIALVGITSALPLLTYLLPDIRSEVPLNAYPVIVVAAFILGLILAPLVARALFYLPLLAAHIANSAFIGPYRSARLRRRVVPTFQQSSERLARRRRELAQELDQMLRTKENISVVLSTRGPEDAGSKRRLVAAGEALGAGIQARQDAIETVDVIQCELDCQRLECEIGAVRLLPSDHSGALLMKRAQAQAVQRNLETLQHQVRLVRDAGRQARARRALESAKATLRTAVEDIHAVEDQGLLSQAASLLRRVEPVQEQLAPEPSDAHLEFPDFAQQLLRIEGAVTECLEQKYRLHAEMEAVDDISTLCDENADTHESRTLGARHEDKWT